MSGKFEYHGDLAVTPLAEILATIHRYRVPGIVNVSPEGRARRIVVDDGSVIFAASNEKRLGLVGIPAQTGAASTPRRRARSKPAGRARGSRSGRSCCRWDS